jgi:hypothetical protein
MIRTVVYRSTGKYGRAVALDLGAGAVARRIEDKIVKGENGFGPMDLERLAAGSLSLSRLLLLYSSAEILAASDRALFKSDQAHAVHQDVEALLVSWTVAQGGESAILPGHPVAKIPTTAPASKPTISGKPLTKADLLVKGANDAYRRDQIKFHSGR